MDRQKTAEYICRLRKEKHLTQKQLAEIIFVTDKAVSKWERGNGSPDVSILPLLADALGVTADDILNGGGASQPEREAALAVNSISEIAEDDCNKNTRVKRFAEKRHVKIFLLLPIVWACLFGTVGGMYVYSVLVAHIPADPYVFVGLLFPWFVFSSATGFIPLIVSYAWHRLSLVK
jgi:transcriptional regulator with XRE-family HTH domain